MPCSPKPSARWWRGMLAVDRQAAWSDPPGSGALHRECGDVAFLAAELHPDQLDRLPERPVLVGVAPLLRSAPARPPPAPDGGRTGRRREGRQSGRTQQFPLTHLYHPVTQYHVTSDSYDVFNRRVALQPCAQGSFRRSSCGSLPERGRCPRRRRWPVVGVRRGWLCARARWRRRRAGRWR